MAEVINFDPDDLRPLYTYKARRKYRLSADEIRYIQDHWDAATGGVPGPDYDEHPEWIGKQLVLVNGEWVPVESIMAPDYAGNPALTGKQLVVVDGEWKPVAVLPMPPEPTTEEQKARRWLAQMTGPELTDFHWVELDPAQRVKYTHMQDVPSQEWVINHNLNVGEPRIVTVGADGYTTIVGGLDRVTSTANKTVILFALAVAGTAYVIGD